MIHVLGIDAGGTKTVCLLADGAGRILASAKGDGANLKTVGELEVEKVLHTVMDEALGHRDIAPVAICLGIAGADRESDGRTVRAIMRRIGLKARTVIVNDALVALVAGVGDGPGVVVIAGTGSIAYGRDRLNRGARAGGWGHLLGDEGSGYWIGRRALAAVVRQADGRGPATSLSGLVLAHLGLAGTTDLVPLVYDRSLPPAAVAALGVVVQRARDEGDGVATSILDAASAELSLAAQSVVARLGMEADEFPFVLAGGIFQGVPWLAADVQRRLTAIAPRAEVRLLGVEPAIGAVHLALAEAHGGAVVPVYVQSG